VAAEIARDLGVLVQGVDKCLRELCRQHRAKNRRELARVLGRKVPLLSERVLALWRRGMSVTEMARELGESVRRVGTTVRYLRAEGEGRGESRMTKREIRIKAE
jgi:predicted transcriptional regulator